MQSQILRLEKNLKEHHPGAWGNLNPGMLLPEWERLTHSVGFTFPADIIEFYSWKNGSRLYLGSDEENDAQETIFLQHGIFVDIRCAILEGANLWLAKNRSAHMVLEEASRILGNTMQNMLCLFAHTPWSPDPNVWESSECSKLFCLCAENASCSGPLFFQEAYLGYDEFMYDNLFSLLEEVNFAYENSLVEVSLKNVNGVERFVFEVKDWISIRDFRIKNNPLCAELNKALWGCAWPSRDL
jgi:hypothetical protein